MESDRLLAEYKRRDFLCLLAGGGLLAPVRVRLVEGGIYEAFTGKIELGQGSRTLLLQALAEELRIPIERIRLTMGDTGSVPDDGGTWASLTTPETVPAVRQAAAEF
ncbi:MAG: molybdopterin-dependent oxidoreductase, partial [Acidobacteria bacterium]|nr:molybdopterin-dependent oxidoreductase [Acidobacteriota bacterium]